MGPSYVMLPLKVVASTLVRSVSSIVILPLTVSAVRLPETLATLTASFTVSILISPDASLSSMDP